MSAAVQRFMQLHQQSQPFILVNVWDATSLMLAQQQGAVAVATSSAALAWSLGYADGAALPATELIAAVHRLLRVSKVPLSIDIEQGYSDDPRQVAQLVKQLAEAGIAGINLEDGRDEPEQLAEKIMACRQFLAGIPLFINARTDVYLSQLCSPDAAIDECISRFKRYQQAGADGAFIPGLADLAEVTQLHRQLTLPINLMGWPADATHKTLNEAGVKRISSGPTLFLQCYSYYQQACRSFLQIEHPEEQALTYAGLNQLFSQPD
ncbi:2-methylisocitrate lyase-like PEP mutase family enzyme [Rheinheimera pacifica]|uniref:isocitrate lyase/PEP mutase family protein n=1 Tax=Rheinheimera pacifica TaxID=173990 RepID=UPI002169461B|nr:isocitrate lyase/phosphoenolpyruvate mutase family protein [Rheinheimera pacifica]MCS4308250.1 2-methylisocitrate lyase-like PEP mutase family enzyme [Rheinheimera pacifica]